MSYVYTVIIRMFHFLLSDPLKASFALHKSHYIIEYK